MLETMKTGQDSGLCVCEVFCTNDEEDVHYGQTKSLCDAQQCADRRTADMTRGQVLHAMSDMTSAMRDGQ